jgi:hypothetical protein
MILHHSMRCSHKAGLEPPPARVRRHHPDFDRQATQGWKAADAEGRLATAGLADPTFEAGSIVLVQSSPLRAYLKYFRSEAFWPFAVGIMSSL